MDHTFNVWSICLSDDRFSCEFDVSPQELIELNKGTESLIRTFVACAGISARPKEWTVQPFCSPWFDDDVQNGDFRDRFPRVWRVTIQLAEQEPPSAPRPKVFGPDACDGFDETWEQTDDYIEWTRCRCVVLADFPAKDAEAAARELITAGWGETRTCTINAYWRQLRIDLGELSFPGPEEKIDKVVGLCRKLGGSTDWGTSLLRSMQEG